MWVRVIAQSRKKEKSLQTIKENNQKQGQLVEILKPAKGQRIKPLKQTERDTTTKSDELIKAKTRNKKKGNKKPMTKKRVREGN